MHTDYHAISAINWYHATLAMIKEFNDEKALSKPVPVVNYLLSNRYGHLVVSYPRPFSLLSSARIKRRG